MRFLLALTLCLMTAPALAQNTAAPAAPAAPVAAATVQVQNASTMAVNSVIPVAAVYMTIVNTGTVDDALIGAKTARTENVELHTNAQDDKGVLSMRPIQAVAVPAGKSARLWQYGDHIMLSGLKDAVKQGETFDLTLVFAKAGEVPVKVHALSGDELLRRFPPSPEESAEAEADARAGEAAIKARKSAPASAPAAHGAMDHSGH